MGFRGLYCPTLEIEFLVDWGGWYEIYPQLSIFFSEIMSKYTK